MDGGLVLVDVPFHSSVSTTKNVFHSSVFKKASFLGLLYLAQTSPRGYLRYLPIILRENHVSLKDLSSLVLFSFTELLKPFFALYLDSQTFRTVSSKKVLLIFVQFCVMCIFALMSTIEIPSIRQIGLLFMAVNILLVIHDAAVDGIAVQILSPKDTPYGAFGQYAGYKVAGLLTTGLLPVLLGTSNRMFCLSISGIFAVVLFYTSFIQIHQAPPTHHSFAAKPCGSGDAGPSCLATVSISPTTSPKTNDSASPRLLSSASLHPIFTLLEAMPKVHLLPVLLMYKLGEHGADYIWPAMLVDAGVPRPQILQSQFLLGNIAALFGAWMGARAVSVRGDPRSALAGCAAARLLPGFMQLVFALARSPTTTTTTWCRSGVRSLGFVATHAVVENVVGSAVTSSMFAFLLASADPSRPASSYATMNALITVGMRMGEYLAAVLSHSIGYASVCAMACLFNAAYVVVVLCLK